MISGWWFGTMEFYDFPFSWEFHHPNWRTHSMIFQRGRSTTNQMIYPWNMSHKVVFLQLEMGDKIPTSSTTNQIFFLKNSVILPIHRFPTSKDLNFPRRESLNLGHRTGVSRRVVGEWLVKNHPWKVKSTRFFLTKKMEEIPKLWEILFHSVISPHFRNHFQFFMMFPFLFTTSICLIPFLQSGPHRPAHHA